MTDQQKKKSLHELQQTTDWHLEEFKKHGRADRKLYFTSMTTNIQYRPFEWW